MPFGATLLMDGGGVRFRLWAPSIARVDVELTFNGEHTVRQMGASGAGWHELIVAEAIAGTPYKFLIHSAGQTPLSVPDPASRHNPDGVHGNSVVVDPFRYTWTNRTWRGRRWADLVLYELHVGTFTARGTFFSAQQRLADLASVGINALQLMPIGAFPGERNWGYDGVLPYAPAACYGNPEDFKGLVDAAHTLGMVVLLDVVYNHFGPDGNYLHAYCPEFFHTERKTPWGAAINFDGEHSRTVRDYFIHNALFWIEEYQIDGLRLDAVHAMQDTSSPDIVCEIASAVKLGPGQSRDIHITLENNRNEARYLVRKDATHARCATAQWNDDVHHALHVICTHETDGYYADYAASPLYHLGRSLAEGFAYQGEHSEFRNKPRGEPSRELPPTAFIDFLQNHDMIGNRAFGERIQRIADARLLHAMYACLLLAPSVPMLFMGEEFGASTPFFYFCDFQGELARSVSNGRRREFSRFTAFKHEAQRALIPDPNDPLTFMASQLPWGERNLPGHREWLNFIRHLLTLRRLHLSDRLPQLLRGGEFCIDAAALLRVQWQLAVDVVWQLRVYFGNEFAEAPSVDTKQIIYSHGVSVTAGAHATFEPGAVEVAVIGQR
jgi:maltooligosyltrehalose trehalohydrolase